ncbi:MAG: amidohydrolase, partial [Chitinophagales bacterium]
MAEIILCNGIVLTQDKKNPHATAIAIKDGKFFAIGNDDVLLLKDAQTAIVDLNNKIVIPGFNDAHIHIWKVGNMLAYMLDLREVKSIEEMLDKLNDHIHAHPELEWIQARGFNEANFKDKRFPNKNDLDTISTTKPICVTRVCAHQIVVNSKALEIAGINSATPTPAGGEIKKLNNGELGGHFTETATGLILSKIPKYNAAQYREMILAAQDELIKYGITSATDPAVEKDIIDVYKQMDRNGELKIRVNLFPIRVPDGANKIYPLPEKYSSPHLKIDTVKFFADGGISGKTAALKKTYKNSNEHGVLRLDKELFLLLAKETQDAGFRIATHAIGDAAIEMVLDVYKRINEFNAQYINHRIEHLGLPTGDDLQLMKKLNVSAVMQPVFIYELGKNFREYVDDDYLDYLYPLRRVMDAGINLSLSTDAPVVKNFDPLGNIRSAMERLDNDGFSIAPNEKITFEEA